MALLLCLLGTPLAALDRHDLWNRDRAEFFAAICMDSAPTFAAADDIYERRRSSTHAMGALRPMDARVELFEESGSCNCLVSFTGQDQEKIFLMVAQTIVAGYRDEVAPQADWEPGMIPFSFEGQRVEVSFNRVTNSTNGLRVAIIATRQGACPI